MIFLWATFAATGAVALEYMYRTFPGTYFSNMWMFMPVQFAISYGIYQLVRQPGLSLIDAFVVWALGTTALRLLVSIVILKDTVTVGTWIALGLLLLARAAQMAYGK